MRSFFDTSVLIPAFLEDHEHHNASFDVFSAAEKPQGYCGAHSLAEVYSSLTRMPGTHRLSAPRAVLIVRQIKDRLTVLSLDPEEYQATISDAAAAGITGGAIYDALLVRCALKADVDTIYTWNLRHFQRFGPDVRRRLRTP